MGYNLTTHDGLMPDDFILILNPQELESLRTALRNESGRLQQQGFDGLRAYVDSLRGKIADMMIAQAQARLDSDMKV